ncbi:hypothetical protein LNAOJCKE_4083 [Methylorubrum aminovorans]|uniref:Uncharacterized protein n=1 Tax=Methylorubrum aminovorans TaxID=269069 RepID=A0ABQ4UIA1_9HYPH|nr:hypothetical protein [Methylorubrum aminovorans]GJE66859.1 hypothetical protein LNAOJCKE_4083 [Methylorubrum aminovorans]GMA74933.1 hypothetical protein GCM10025880_13500 [Methylorubrum aminovorans]
MSIATDISLDAGSRLGMVGAFAHLGVQRAMADIKREQRRETNAVADVAARLREARLGQVAALRRAAAAEARAAEAEEEAAGAKREIRLLREALRAERSLTAGLKEICGVA